MVWYWKMGYISNAYLNRRAKNGKYFNAADITWMKEKISCGSHTQCGREFQEWPPRFNACIPWIYKCNEISFQCLRYALWLSWPEDRGGPNLIIQATLKAENFLWPVVDWESERFRTWEEFASPWLVWRERACHMRKNAGDFKKLSKAWSWKSGRK